MGWLRPLADPLPTTTVMDPPLPAGFGKASKRTAQRQDLGAPWLERVQCGVKSRDPRCPGSGLLPAETPGIATLARVAPSSSFIQNVPGRPSSDNPMAVEIIELITGSQAQTRWARGPRERGGLTQKRAHPGPPSSAPLSTSDIILINLVALTSGFAHVFVWW